MNEQPITLAAAVEEEVQTVIGQLMIQLCSARAELRIAQQTVAALQATVRELEKVPQPQ